MQLLWVSCEVEDADLVFQNNHYPGERGGEERWKEREEGKERRRERGGREEEGEGEKVGGLISFSMSIPWLLGNQQLWNVPLKKVHH